MMLDDSLDLLLTPNPKQSEEETIQLPTHKCKQQYLLKSNFLSEFLTKSDKEKVLQNLGIYEIGGGSWGNIKGNLEEQTDLIAYINNPSNISYKTSDNPFITNVQQALDEALYKELETTIVTTPQLVELGTTISSINISWNYNKTIVAQSLNGISLPSNKRNYNLQGVFSNTQSITLNVLDSKKLTTYNTLVEFVPAIYYTDSTSIPTLPTTKKILSKDGNCEININALNYIYIFIPTKYNKSKFYVGGFEGGFQKLKTTLYNNIQYDIWRSDNANLGKLTINIK